MRLLSALKQEIIDGLNPVMVKELRQAVRSGLVTAALAGLLAVQLVVVTVYLFLRYRAAESVPMGQELFVVLQGILLVLCTLFFPFYSAVRLAGERAVDHTDMLFLTTMRPASIALGKLLAAAVLAFLFFATSAPFLFATWLMRGIDIPSMVFSLWGGFLLVVASVAGAIALASVRVSVATRTLLAAGLALGLLMVAAVGVTGLGALATSGIGDRLGTWGFCGWSTVVGLDAAEIVGLLVLLAAAQFTHPAGNRMLPVRLFLTGAWAVTGLASLLASAIASSVVPLLVWVALQVCVAAFMLLVGVCEREEWSVRIRRQIPKGKFARVVVFPLFSGWGNATAWCVLGTILTLIAGSVGALVAVGVEGVLVVGSAIVFGMFAMNVYAVSTTALLLRRALLRQRVKPSMTWLLALGVLFVVTVVPFVLAFLVGRLIGGSVTGGLIGMMVFATFSPTLSMIVGGIWALLVFGLSMPWFVQQCRAFRPYRTTPPLPTPLMLAQARAAWEKAYG